MHGDKALLCMIIRQHGEPARIGSAE